MGARLFSCSSPPSRFALSAIIRPDLEVAHGWDGRALTTLTLVAQLDQDYMAGT